MDKKEFTKKDIEDIFESIINEKVLSKNFLHERLDQLLKIKYRYLG